MSLSINQIHLGDARYLLPQVALNSINCSVWSPPYFVGKQYEKYLSYEEWKTLLETVVLHHFGLLKPGGFMVVNIADILCFADESMPKIQAQNISRHRSTVSREAVLSLSERFPTHNRRQLAEILGCSEQTIDRRMHGNNIRGGKYNTQTRVHLVGEILEKAAMKAGLYLYDRRVWIKDAAWENSKWATLSYRSIDEFEYLYFFWKPGETIVDRERLTSKEWGEWGSRGVWHMASVRANDDHEAKFPIELPRRVMKLLTAHGDTVLDCFMGSGTTGVAAILEGRNYLGIELNPKYVELSRRNCARAEALQLSQTDDSPDNYRPQKPLQLKLMEKTSH